MQTTNNPIAADPALKAVYIKAVTMLGRRDYSTAELTEKLLQKGVAEEHCEPVLDYLTRKGYLNDRRYGQRLIEKAKGLYGRHRITQILYQHKLKGELIRELLEAFDDSDAESDIVARLHRLLHSRPIEAEQTQKLVAKLMRLGYSYEAVRNAMLRYAEETEEGSES